MTAMEPVELIVDDARAPYAAGVVSVGELELVVSERGLGSGRRIDLVVRNGGRTEVTIERVGVRLDGSPAEVLEHGYQSWSPVRRCGVGDVRPERADVPDWARGMHAADPSAS